MAIDYSETASSIFSAPVMRLDDKGHGFVGVIFDATTRQATDYESRQPKWWVPGKKRPVASEEQPANSRPVLDYVFHIAAEQGMGAFTKRDDDTGEVVKTSSGRAVLDVRKLDHEDIAIVAANKWLIDAVTEARLNTGHRVKVMRNSPARDENGDRMTIVDCTVEVLGKVDNPDRFDKSQASDGIDWGDDSDTPAEQPEMAEAPW